MVSRTGYTGEFGFELFIARNMPGGCGRCFWRPVAATG
jgi:glycine cleavage system aminomethyltransferase T